MAKRKGMRCSFIREDGTQCACWASRELIETDKGFGRCRHHGGKIPARKRLERNVAPALAFWDPESLPTKDVGEALLELSGRLTNTLEYLGDELNQNIDTHVLALAEWREAKDSGIGVCDCCGFDLQNLQAPRPPLASSTAQMWQFVVKELAKLLPQIHALGLAERQIAYQEEQAAFFGRILVSALASAGVDDATADVVRGEIIAAIRTLEVEGG